MSLLVEDTMDQKRVIRSEASSLFDEFVKNKKKLDEEEITIESFDKYKRGLMKKADAFREKYGYKREYVELINSIVARMIL